MHTFNWRSFVSERRRGRAGSVLLIMSLSLAIVSTACSGGETNTNANSAPSEAAKAPQLQKVPGDTSYSVDSINNSPVPKSGPVIVKAGERPTVIIAGWAVDGAAKAPAGGVIFSIDGKSEMTATYGAERPDVASVLKEPNYKLSGFGLAIPTQSLEKGRHAITMKILTSDKKGYYEPNRKFEIEVQ